MTLPLPKSIDPDFRFFFAGPESPNSRQLTDQLHNQFPNCTGRGFVSIIHVVHEAIQNFQPDIIFFELQFWKEYKSSTINNYSNPPFETIIIHNTEINFLETIQNAITGHLRTPVQSELLLQVVQYALQRKREKINLLENQRLIQKLIQKRIQETKVGIPTIEGYEFFEVKEILFCEALRKYTRVVTKGKRDAISSYNLGEFKQLLEPYGFFSPHRSYLINLRHIQKYHKEGTIFLGDGTTIPVAKRMKKEFLEMVSRL